MLMGAKMCEGCGEKRASFPNGLEGIDDREAPMVRRLRQAPPWGRAAGEAHDARKDTREQLADSDEEVDALGDESLASANGASSWG